MTALVPFAERQNIYMNAESKIKRVLWENGLLNCPENEIDKIDLLAIGETIGEIDSFSMIALVVSLENELSITIPDEMLVTEPFSWNDFYRNIIFLISENHNC